ncbi:MAG: ABC transporter substrate-binding protein [Actinomycetia bacterium]|nr:ABC transporter substrate-binding protein [Actinomycetes bacterium]
MGRRTVLKGLGALGAGAVAAPLLAACGSSKPKSTSNSSAPAGTSGAPGGAASTPAAGGGSATFGSNYSDPAPKQAFAALTDAATAATGVNISINTVDHNTFQNNINSYLQGTPNDMFTWFAGYRLQTFAKTGLLRQIDDVWDSVGSNFGDAAQSLSKGQDGHYYLVPIYNYPWVIFYNKSTFDKNGYQIPTTWDDMISLCKQMQKDGLIPFALAQKDGWPALGTFDILNMRINGYDYHMQLMQHQVPWTDAGVTAVFNQWAELIPYCQTGAPGRIWQDASKTLEQKKAGMLFQGTNQVAAQYVTDKADLNDLDFFVYPEINSAYGQDYMDAPTDGFCIAAKAKNVDPAVKVLEYIGTPAAAEAYLKYDQWDVAVANGANIPTYNAVQTKSVQVIQACKAVAQFMDRDSDGAFADNIVSAAIDSFLTNTSASNIKSIQSSLEAQAKSVFSG